MSCTIASFHFSSLYISSNLNMFFHVFRYLIYFWAFEFSVVIKRIYYFVRDSSIVCTNTSSFLCNFNASLILSRYSIALIVEIRFFDLAIIRLLNHVSDFADFAKSFFSCILALFVISRDTTCAHKIHKDAFFDIF